MFHTFSLRYCKDIANWLFWVLWACLATYTQSDTINLKKTFMFICRQKINSPCFSGDIVKMCKLVILGILDMSGYAPKKIVLTRGKLRCLSACQKYTSSLPSLLRYLLHFKKSRNLINQEHFGP